MESWSLNELFYFIFISTEWRRTFTPGQYSMTSSIHCKNYRSWRGSNEPISEPSSPLIRHCPAKKGYQPVSGIDKGHLKWRAMRYSLRNIAWRCGFLHTIKIASGQSPPVLTGHGCQQPKPKKIHNLDSPAVSHKLSSIVWSSTWISWT